MDTLDKSHTGHLSTRARMWLALPYILLVLSFAYTLYAQHHETNQRIDGIAQTQVDADYHSCLVGNEVRGVIRDLVAASGSTGLDLTSIPSFKDVDPVTQKYLTELSQRINAADTPSDKNTTLDKVQLRNCNDEFPTHTKEAQ